MSTQKMTMTEFQKKRTFGPVIEHMKDGTFRALCTWCAFRVGNECTYVKPSRRMPDPENTPEWCPMREDMIQEAEAAAKRKLVEQFNEWAPPQTIREETGQ